MAERKDSGGTVKVIKILLWTSLFFTFASFASCHFGVQYEISKISPDVRKGMADFDWIGVEWIAAGTIAIFLAIVLALVALMLWIVRRQRKREEPTTYLF